MASPPSVAVVGAGPAGLAAAVALSGAARLTVFDKARGVSGRAATRWRDAADLDGRPFRWRYDHGAQYASPDSDGAVAAFVRAHAGDGLAEIDGRVVPFDDAGAVRLDQVRDDPGLRWTWPDGIAGLGRRLSDAADAELRLQTRVTRLAHGPAGWTVEADGAEGGASSFGPFSAVVLTPPAPQAADLVRASDLGPVGGAALADALGAVTYRSQFSVVWAFGHAVERPADAYAFVNAAGKGGGGGHAVAWVAVESDKPGRAPDGASLVVAQMSDGWTEAHYDDDRAAVVRAAAAALADLWGPLPDPLWTDTQRWRYSLPNGAVDAAALDEAAGHGLIVAGDATAGTGRVHLAIGEGLRAADQVLGR